MRKIISAAVLFFPMALSAGTPLMTGPARPPLQRILFNGARWVSPPAVSRDGSVWLAWRSITGALNRNLVTTVFLQRLRPDGTLPWGGIPRAPVQAMHDLGDRGQGGGEHGVAPDGQGGIYYLWASYLLRFDGNGRSLWPKGKQFLRNPGPLWQRPSRIRYILSKRERIRDIRLESDGAGHALVYWRSPSSVRVNRITPDGRRLWGPRGITLCSSTETYENGTGVAGWKGWAVALVSTGRYGNRSVVKYVSPDGRTIRSSPVQDIDLGGSERWRLAADGRGGIVVLYRRLVFRDNLSIGCRLRVRRIDRSGRRLYDRAVSSFLPNARGPVDQVLRIMDDGTVLVSWQEKNAAPGIPSVDIRICRLRADGTPAWPQPASVPKPRLLGGRSWNEGGRVALITRGAATLVLYELTRLVNDQGITHILLQQIGKDGKPRHHDGGKLVSPGGGYYPYLVRTGGRILAFYYDNRTIGTVSEHNLPVMVVPE